MSTTSKFELFDIVMYERQEWTTKNWIGYISNARLDPSGFISVIWWDQELEVWTLAQSIPVKNLDFIGRVGDFL